MVSVLCIDLVDQASFANYGGLDYDDGIEVVEEVLGLNHTDIGGFQRIGTNNAIRTIHFSLSNAAYESPDVQVNLNKSRRLSSGKIITVSKPDLEINEVYVRHAPMTWEDDRIRRIFTWYGHVKHLDHQTIQRHETTNPSYVGKRNGIIKLKIKLTKDIPSTMSIDGRRLEIYYKDQVRTCFKCGGRHLRSQCASEKGEFFNRFSLEEFPEIGDAERTHSASRQEEQGEMEVTPEVTVATVETVVQESSITVANESVGAGEATTVNSVDSVVAGEATAADSLESVVAGEATTAMESVVAGEATTATNVESVVAGDATTGGNVENVVVDEVLVQDGVVAPMDQDSGVHGQSGVEAPVEREEAAGYSQDDIQIAMQDWASEVDNTLNPDMSVVDKAPVVVEPAYPSEAPQWRRYMNALMSAISPDLKTRAQVHRRNESTSASEEEPDHLITPGQVENSIIDNNIDNDENDMIFFETADTIELVESVVSDPLLLTTQDFQSANQEQPRSDSVKRPIESSTDEDSNNNNVLNPATGKSATNTKNVKQQKLNESEQEDNSGIQSVPTEMDTETS